MRMLIALIVSISLGVACGSKSGNNRANSPPASTNTNANAASTLNENAYTFAQNSDVAGYLTPSGKEAREIVGKTVTESKLWHNAKFSGRLTKLMGTDFATMKKFWNTETPIRKFGDFLMMTGCEQHNCSNNQYVIFIDLGDGCINVVHIGEDATKEWNSYGDIDLPPPFAQDLAAMKSRIQEGK